MMLRHEGFRKLCEARDLLLSVPDDAPTIEAIARTVGLSRAHFIRQFEAVFGLTPHQYRIQARLDRARQLLARGDWSVTDVCCEVGFTSLGSFSVLFTNRVGETPSGYRRRWLAATHGGSTPLKQPGCLTLLAHLPVDWSFREALLPSP